MANKYGELQEIDSSDGDERLVIHPLKLGVNVIGSDLNADIRLYSVGSRCFVDVDAKKMATVASKSNISLVEVNGKCLRKGKTYLLLPNDTITFGNTKLTYVNSNLTEQEIAQFQRNEAKPKIFTTPRHRASNYFGANIFRPSKPQQFNWQADAYDIMPRPSPSHESVDSENIDGSLQTSESNSVVNCTEITEPKNADDSVCIIEEKFEVISIADTDVGSPRITKSLKKMMNIASRSKSSAKRTTTTLEKEFPPLLLHENEGAHSEHVMEVEELLNMEVEESTNVLPYCETDVNKSQHSEELEPDSSTNTDSENSVLVKTQHSSTPTVAIKPLLENSSSQPSSTNKNLDRTVYTDAITNTPSVVSHSFYSISPDRLLCMENDDISGITLLNSPTKSQETNDTESVQDPQCNSSQNDVEEEEFWEPVMCADDDSQSDYSDMTEYEFQIATEEELAMPYVDPTTDIDFPYSPYNGLSDTCNTDTDTDDESSFERKVSLRGGFSSPASSACTTPRLKKSHINSPISTASTVILENEWEITEITHPVTPSTNVNLLNSSRNIAIIQPTVQSTMKKSLNTVGTGQNSPNGKTSTISKSQVSDMQETENAETFHQTDHDSVMKTPSPKQNLSHVAKLQTSLLKERSNSLNKSSSLGECCVKTPNHSPDLSAQDEILILQEQVNSPGQCFMPTQSERKSQIDDLSTVSSTSAEVVMSAPGHSTKDESLTRTPDRQKLTRSLTKLQASGHLADCVDVEEAVNPMESYDIEKEVFEPLKESVDAKKSLIGHPSTDYSFEEGVFDSSPNQGVVATRTPAKQNILNKENISRLSRSMNKLRTSGSSIDYDDSEEISKPLQESFVKLEDVCNTKTPSTKSKVQGVEKVTHSAKKLAIDDLSTEPSNNMGVSDCLYEQDPPARRISTEQNTPNKKNISQLSRSVKTLKTYDSPVNHHDGEEISQPLKESIDKYEDEFDTKTPTNRKMQSARKITRSAKKVPIIELSSESSDNEEILDSLPQSDLPATRTPAKQNTLSIENISRLSRSVKKLQTHDSSISLKDGEDTAKPLQESANELGEKNDTNTPSPNHKVQSVRKVTRSAKKLLFGESIDNDGDSDSLQEENLPAMRTLAQQNTPNISRLSHSVKELQTCDSSIDLNNGEEITIPLQESDGELGDEVDTNTPSPNHKVQSVRKVTRSAKKLLFGELSTESIDNDEDSDSLQEENLPARRTPAKQDTPNISRLSRSVKKLQTRDSSIDLHDGEEITKPLQESVGELGEKNDTNTPPPNHTVQTARKVTRSAKQLPIGELSSESSENEGDSDSLQQENLSETRTPAKHNTPNISRLSHSAKELQTCDSSIDLNDDEEITIPLQESVGELGDEVDTNTPPNHKVQSARKVTRSAKKLPIGELSTESSDNEEVYNPLPEPNLNTTKTPAKQNTPNISRLTRSVKKLGTHDSSFDLNDGEEILKPLQELADELRDKNDTNTPPPIPKVQSARKSRRSAKKLPIGELSTESSDNEGVSDFLPEPNLNVTKTPAKLVQGATNVTRSVEKLSIGELSTESSDNEGVSDSLPESYLLAIGTPTEQNTPNIKNICKLSHSVKKSKSRDGSVDYEEISKSLQEPLHKFEDECDAKTPPTNQKVQGIEKLTGFIKKSLIDNVLTTEDFINSEKNRPINFEGNTKTPPINGNVSSVNKTVLQHTSDHNLTCTPGDEELNQIQKDLSKNSLLKTPVTNLKIPSATSTRLTRSMRKKLIFADSTTKKSCPDESDNDLSDELGPKTPSTKIAHIGLLSGKDLNDSLNKDTVFNSSPSIAKLRHSTRKTQNSSSNQGDPQESIKQKLMFDDEESSDYPPDPNKCEKSAVETTCINEVSNLSLREHNNLSDSVDHKDTNELLSTPKSVLKTQLASKNSAVGKHFTRSAKKKLIIDISDNTTLQGADEFDMATPSTSRNLQALFVETVDVQVIDTSINTSTFPPTPIQHTLEASKRKRSPEIVISNERDVKRIRTLEAENSSTNDHTDVIIGSETPMAQKEPINDLRDVRGVRNLFETKQSPNNDLTDIKGVKKMYATPKIRRSPKNDLSDIRGVKKILKSPKPQKEPKNDLQNVRGVRSLFEPKETKSPYNNLTDVKGVKRIYATPINRQSPKNDLSDIKGVRKIFKTPKLRDERSPINDLSNIKGVRKLYASPRIRRSPKDDLTDVKGLKKLFKTQKPQKEPKNDLEDVRGVKQLYTSPKLRHSPKNELSDFRGVRKMFQTPKIQREPKNDLSDVRGIRNLLRTPKSQKKSNDLEDISGLANLFENEFDRLIEKKPVRQYPGKTTPIKSPLTRERKAIFDLSKSTESHVEKWVKDQNQELQENNENLSEILSEIQNKSTVNVSYKTSTPISKSSKENFVPQSLSPDDEESYGSGKSTRIKRIPAKLADRFILHNLSVKLQRESSIDVRNTTDLEKEQIQKTPLKMFQRKESPEKDTEENKVHVRPVRGRRTVKARGEEKHDSMSSNDLNSSTQSQKEANKPKHKRGESKSKTDGSGNNTDENFVVPTRNLGRKRKIPQRYEEADMEEEIKLIRPKMRRAHHDKQLDRDIDSTELEGNDDEKEEINETVELLQPRVTRGRRPKQLNEGNDTTDNVKSTSTRTQKNLKPEKDDIRPTRGRRAKQVGQDANITGNDSLTKPISTRKQKNLEPEELKEKSVEEPLQLRPRKGRDLKQLHQEVDTTDDGSFVKPTAPRKRKLPEPEEVQLQTRATRSRAVKRVIDLSLNDSHTSTKQALHEKTKEDTKKSPDTKPEPRQLRSRRVHWANEINDKFDLSHNDSHTSTKQTDLQSVQGRNEEDAEKSMEPPIQPKLRRGRAVKEINNEAHMSPSDSRLKPTLTRRQKNAEPPIPSVSDTKLGENETETELKTTVRTRRKLNELKSNETGGAEPSSNDIKTSEFVKNTTEPKTTRKRGRQQTDTDENEPSDKNGNVKSQKIRKTAKDIVNEAMVAISTRSNRRAVKTMVNTFEMNDSKGSDQPVTRSRRKILS